MTTRTGSVEDSGLEDAQYGLAKILCIWAVVTIPMALLAWVAAPLLIPRFQLEPGIVYWLLMICGMAWQFIVSIVVLRRERARWSWDGLRQRLWLDAPRDLHTRRRNLRLLWWIVPGIAFVGVTSDLLGHFIDAPFQSLFPQLRMPAYTDVWTLAVPAFEGQWWLLAVALTSCVFNYLLGEALLFHGVLLPRMLGVFGKWAWLANGVLFGLYHVHLITALPSITISNLAYSAPAQRFRSNWLAIAIHGFEGVVLCAVVVWVILGMPGSLRR